MKRDRRLQGLSSDHHHALVLARTLLREVEQGTWSVEKGERFAQIFDRELQPHFLTEEELLLSALQKQANELVVELVERTLSDHQFLRARVSEIRQGDAQATEKFARRLHEHVRFEERKLFPACERHLEDAILDAVFQRAPKLRTNSSE